MVDSARSTLPMHHEVAEGGVDKITAKRIAGHITDKMWDKYSQVRFDSVREKMMGAFTPINVQSQTPKESARRRIATESVARSQPEKVARRCEVPARNLLTDLPRPPAAKAGEFHVPTNTWPSNPW
jgi:hypothetical protein